MTMYCGGAPMSPATCGVADANMFRGVGKAPRLGAVVSGTRVPPAGDETKQSHRVARAALAAPGLGCSQFTVGLRFYSDAIPPNRGAVPCGGLSARWRGRRSRGADVADAGARGRWWGRAGCSLVACTGLRTRCRTGRWWGWRTGGANITGGRLRATCAGLRGEAGAARGRGWRAGSAHAARAGLRTDPAAAGRWRDPGGSHGARVIGDACGRACDVTHDCCSSPSA